jgi:hypothetical protein
LPNIVIKDFISSIKLDEGESNSMTKQREESSKDPMSPENITEHEPTAVKRDPNDQGIVEGGKPVLILLNQEKNLCGMTKV